MSVFGLPYGVPNSARGTLASGSATTMLAAGDRQLFVVGIQITNHSGGSLTPTVDIYDGTNTFIVRDNASLSDTATEPVKIPEFLHLKPGDSLRVTSAANLAYFVSYLYAPVSRQGT